MDSWLGVYVGGGVGLQFYLLPALGCHEWRWGTLLWDSMREVVSPLFWVRPSLLQA